MAGRKRRISQTGSTCVQAAASYPLRLDVEVTEARPGQCPPRGGGLRVRLSRAQPSSHWSPGWGRDGGTGRPELVPLDFHVSSATPQWPGQKALGRRMTDEGPRRRPLRWTHTGLSQSAGQGESRGSLVAEWIRPDSEIQIQHQYSLPEQLTSWPLPLLEDPPMMGSLSF